MITVTNVILLCAHGMHTWNNNLTIFTEQNHLEQHHFQVQPDNFDDQLSTEILKVSYIKIINHVFSYYH